MGGSSVSSSMQSDELIKSLFLVLKFDYGGYRAMMYSFKVDSTNGMIITPPEDGDGVVFHIQQFYDKDDHKMRAVRPLECARLCGSSHVYFLFNKGKYSYPIPPPPDGIIYDAATLSCISSFALPREKPYGPLISAYGKLYHFLDPCSFPHIPNDNESFQCYDPSTGLWELLSSCPFYSCKRWNSLRTIGHAVCSGCILYSLVNTLDNHRQLVLYHINENMWHKVGITNSSLDRHYPFEGKAVVIDDIIYTVAKYSLDVIIVCKLRIETYPYSFFLDTLAALEATVVPPPTPFQSLLTRYLTFIGDNMFCLFTTARIDWPHVKCVCVTTFQIAFQEDCSMHLTTLHSRVLKFYHPRNSDATISLCFTQDCDDTEEKKRGMYRKATI